MGFFGHGNVLSAGRYNQNGAISGNRHVFFGKDRHTGLWMVLSPGKYFGNRFGLAGVQTGYPDDLLLDRYFFHDANYLLRCFALAENDLRKSLSKRAVVVNIGVSDIFKV